MLPVGVASAASVERTASANRQASEVMPAGFALRHICAHHVAGLNAVNALVGHAGASREAVRLKRRPA
jgi:hypothetical protein